MNNSIKSYVYSIFTKHDDETNKECRIALDTINITIHVCMV